MAQRGSMDLLLIYLVFLLLSIFVLATQALQHIEGCYQWLDRVDRKDQAEKEEFFYCLGELWQQPPAQLDYGAAFQKNWDAPVLCELQKELPALGEHLRCE